FYTSYRKVGRKAEKEGEWLWSREAGTMIYFPSSPSPTLSAVTVVTLELPPLHATPLPPKSTVTASSNSPETTRKLSWGFSGSLNTTTTSPKTRNIVITSISTSTPPSPRTPASGLHIQHPNTPDYPFWRILGR
ncbi:hypothetical protein Moror_15454, partial [Moniliophthora roreri MCA 2997]